MEGDSYDGWGADMAAEISIHSLRMEGDYFRRSIFALCRRFQSTPSAWRETPDTRL